MVFNYFCVRDAAAVPEPFSLALEATRLLVMDCPWLRCP
jgi:hypothetical protein